MDRPRFAVRDKHTLPVTISTNSQNQEPMKYLKTVLLSAATLALSFTSSTVVAQDAPAVKYIAQTTSEFVMPDGVTREEVQKTFQEYFDKVISKSTIVKHYNMYIHAWGSLGASYVTTLAVSYTHLRAHETVLDLVCRLLLDKKKSENTKKLHRSGRKLQKAST